MTTQNFLSRRAFVYALIVLGAMTLIAEIAFLFPSGLERWHPYDYWQYVEMGTAVRQGQEPLGPGRYYPLPTILWLFVPLSLLPDWVRLVWVMIPFISILILFREQGILLFLFPPLWFVTSDAMLDGWLLIPLAWLLSNRPLWAGIGAVAMLLKPQLALPTVAFMVLRWILERDWKNLAIFMAALSVFLLPAFILDPGWPLRLVRVLPLRANETLSILPLLTSSVWAWWSVGGLGTIIFLAMLLAMGVVFLRSIREADQRAASVQLANLFLVPVLFASNSITALPTLRGRNEIFAIVLISLAAFAFDHALGGFGGGYAFIPLAAMYFQTRRKAAPQ